MKNEIKRSPKSIRSEKISTKQVPILFRTPVTYQFQTDIGYLKTIRILRGVIISEVRVSKIQVRGYGEKLRFLSAFGVTRWIPK